jgi:hypothetical protein
MIVCNVFTLARNENFLTWLWFDPIASLLISSVC